MSAIDEILELIKNPFADIKVFTTAQIIFLSLLIFLGITALLIYTNTPINSSTLTMGAVGAIITGLFLAVYSWFNKRRGE